MYPWVIRLFVVLVMVELWGCSRPKPPPPPPPPAEETTPGDAIQAFNLASYDDDGRKRWEVLGQTADVQDQTIHLTDITATAYHPKTTVVLTADEGTFDRERQSVHLERDVKAVTTEGTTLTTPSLDWDAERQIASTEQRAVVAREGLTVQGEGATAAPQLKSVRFQRDVQVDLQPATTITCEGPLEVDYARHRARFWRRVHVRDPRGDIWADRMDVWMDPKTRQLTQAQCWGHVTIQQASQRARARRATYHAPTGKMQLIGHPVVTFYPEQADGRTAP
ncbi:MAG: LPS export ABC transporter periplasmic protein LptC [Omnitrophica WOR_2 bacterium RIFCSPHIGHO2_02_FULL_68_15]|nr:MAG: LPS export ABC transporter periplasmic protein LptC [Omnitrophica WOR_2 bacterium RIFCSPHIGHO2_02_FULL_68_15]